MLLQFNIKDDHWIGRHIRSQCLDLGPILFDVVMGRFNLATGCRLMNQFAQERARSKPTLGFSQKLCLVVLLSLATVVLWIALCGF